MFTKKLICSSLMLLSITAHHLSGSKIPVIQANNQATIENAAFYIIHYPDYCSLHLQGRLTGHSLKLCPTANLVEHEEEVLPITYHDKTGKIIAVAYENEELKDQCFNLNKHAQKRLNPKVKVEIVKAVIEKNKRNNAPVIYFYGQDGDFIVSYPYNGELNLGPKSRKQFEKDLDFSNLKIVEDHCSKKHQTYLM